MRNHYPAASTAGRSSATPRVEIFALVTSTTEATMIAPARNQFVHYRPASWSIQLDGMSEMLMHAFDTLSAVLKMGCFYSHFESGDNDRIAALVAEGKALLRKAQENWELRTGN